MARTYQNTRFMRFGNTMMTLLLHMGIQMGATNLLTVRGRKSGQPRTTPITVSKYNGQRHVIAPYGSVNWVRNLRAAGEATLTLGRSSEQVLATELPIEEAAVILKHDLAKAPSFLLAYFNVTPDAPIEDFIRDAPNHPVFQFESKTPEATTGTEQPAHIKKVQ